ncbi:hypothetical protein WKK05_39520 (plasmid) [Nostoc sp. UHCC 0302]|uniref:hypothetical protein n=1 Tax=Nostoc sp. UHCC 0302 TaxID=3134896 RepID=UPI00311CBF51
MDNLSKIFFKSQQHLQFDTHILPAVAPRCLYKSDGCANAKGERYAFAVIGLLVAKPMHL